MTIKATYGTMYYVDDMTSAAAFYEKVVGLKPSYQSAEWTEFTFSGHRLCLHGKRAGEKYSANGILIFALDGIKAAFEQMKREGHEVFGLHEIHPEAWTFHLKDKTGNETSFHGKP